MATSTHTDRQRIPTLRAAADDGEVTHSDDCACKQCAAPTRAPLVAVVERSPYDNPRVQQVIDAAPSTLDEHDWLEVALAALDQAGLSLAQQRGYEAMLRGAFDRREQAIALCREDGQP